MASRIMWKITDMHNILNKKFLDNGFLENLWYFKVYEIAAHYQPNNRQDLP